MKNRLKEVTKNQYGNVTGVILQDGTRLNVNMVVLGTGIAPNTSFLNRTDNGIKMSKDGGISTDPFL